MTPKSYAKALFALTEGVTNVDDIVEKFVAALTDDGKAYLLPSILKHYRVILLKKNQLPEVVIRSSEKIDTKVEQEILKALDIPDDMDVKNEVDKGILGGIFVKWNNRVMDFSLKRKLGRLQQRLEQTH